MQDDTRKKFDAFAVAMAETYGVESLRQEFSIAPTIQQNLRNKIIEQSTFLPKINTFPVEELEGEVLLGAANSRVVSRTNTKVKGKKRVPRNIAGMESHKYKLNKINADIAISYDLIDAWAKFKDFPERIQKWTQEAIANDWETIGWYGESCEEDTDLEANPNLEDVSKGWMQHAREYKGGKNVISSGATADEVRIGIDGDYPNLDVAVNDMTTVIPTYKRKGLVVLVGTDLIAHERAQLFAAVGGKPTEKNAMNMAMSTLGGLPWETPSNFPPRGLVVTSLDNLSIYEQAGKTRRRIKDEPDSDQIEDYSSRNMGYVIEDLEKFVALEFKNVKMPNAESNGWE